MSEGKRVAFEVTPGEPTTIRVKDTDGSRYRMTARLSVVDVVPTGKKNEQTGAPVFEMEFQVAMKTELEAEG